MAGEPVGWFQIRVAGDVSCGTHTSIEICGNEQFYLGRDIELCRYSWSDDLTISRKHLRIHCILYELDPVANIAPLVYATDMSANGTYLKKNNVECVGSQGPGVLMGPDSTFLLDADDELRVSEKVTLIYHPFQKEESFVLTPIQERERLAFASRYLITGRLLGEGGYGKVLAAVHQATQRQLACKIIKLSHLYEIRGVSHFRHDKSAHKSQKRWPTRITTCFREFDILKDLSHPNIIGLQKVFWSRDTIYIFQELVTGGDLFSFLEYKESRLEPPLAAVVIQQILKGVEYLHRHDIVHRDLKPDNILMTSLEDGARVVITDFGNARVLPGKNNATASKTNRYQRMFSCVGTLEFAAPEIHRANQAIPAEQGYSKSVDMWSIGSITATVLTGDVIFTDRTHPAYDKNPRAVIVGLAAACDLHVLDDECHPKWRLIGDRPKDFIRKLLVLEEDGRLTAPEALAHPWFTNEFHAENFKSVYERAIKEWQPRQTSTQFVEPIPRKLPQLSVGIVVRNSLHPKAVSRFFPPPKPGSTDDMLQKVSNAQHWHSNTPLPSIIDDYEQAQIASPIQPLSCDPSGAYNYHQHSLSLVNDSHYCQPADGEQSQNSQAPQMYDRHGSCDTNLSLTCGTPDGQPLGQRPLTFTAASGMCEADATNSEDSYGSCESLNNVMNDYSQQWGCVRDHEEEGLDGVSEFVQVADTPPRENQLQNCSFRGYEQEREHLQTQFSHHTQHQPTQEDQDSMIVCETPPDGT